MSEILSIEPFLQTQQNLYIVGRKCEWCLPCTCKTGT